METLAYTSALARRFPTTATTLRQCPQPRRITGPSYAEELAPRAVAAAVRVLPPRRASNGQRCVVFGPKKTNLGIHNTRPRDTALQTGDKRARA